jgi:ribose transport system permease protein
VIGDARATQEKRSGPDRAAARSRSLLGADLISRYALVLALGALVALFSVLLPETFPTTGNLTTIVTSQAVMLILALGILLPLRTGDFDLSIAANMGVCAALAGTLSQDGIPVPVAMVVALAVGLGIGIVNGILIVVVGINAFIATLGMMTVLGGLAVALTDGHVVAGLPEAITTFSREEILFGLPAGVFYGWILAALVWYVFEYTPFGRYLLFVGGNPDASRLAGIPIRRVRFSAFALSGLFGAFAGIVLVGILGAVDPSIGPQFLLPPYAAAFLSTTTVQVGRFNVIGMLIGLYLLAVGITGLQLIGVASWISDVFNGGALILAVGFAHLARLRQTKQGRMGRRLFGRELT